MGTGSLITDQYTMSASCTCVVMLRRVKSNLNGSTDVSTPEVRQRLSFGKGQLWYIDFRGTYNATLDKECDGWWWIVIDWLIDCLIASQRVACTAEQCSVGGRGRVTDP